MAHSTYTHRHVLDADIEKFFDRVVHRKLIGMMKNQIADNNVLELIESFLKSGFCEWGKPWRETPAGTPQGGPLSPMLANIYLHYALDEKFKDRVGKSENAKLFRFADDLVIVAQNATQIASLKKWVQYELERAVCRKSARTVR